MITTHCSTRLGDNLAHLLLLRRLAKANPSVLFIHAALPCYIAELSEVVADLWPNVRLADQPMTGSIEVWKGRDGHWYNHPNRNEYVEFYLEWHCIIAREMGFESPLKTAADLLFDYPALKCTEEGVFDFLVINSPPLSGQFLGYDQSEMDKMIQWLLRQGSVVTTHSCAFPTNCTLDQGLSVTRIGHLSQHCKCIVMISTGPSWPTFNVWNTDSVKLRVILIDGENLRGLGKNIIQTNKIADVPEILHVAGMV